MVVTSPEITQLEDLLDLVSVRLQPTPTEYDDAQDKYEAVGRWLSAPDSVLAGYLPAVFPQGSFRIGTVIRPLTQLEFDVDLVCEVQIDYRTTEPMVVYRLIESRLRTHDVYRSMVEPKNRCLRLNYAGQFHLDVLPACPNHLKDATAIVVPDREARSWKSSNPKGYATWFDQRAAVWLVEVKAIEPLPSPRPAQAKAPLQKAVQLIKRQRDVAFGTSDAAPRSIVLTTLAGHFYRGERSTSGAITRYLNDVLQSAASTPGPLTVRNPADHEEVLSEQWRDDPSSYHAFIRETKTFARLWSELHAARGMPAIAERLKALFGEDLVATVMKDYGQRIARARETGAIGTAARSSLVLGSPSPARPIPRNTFYGRDPRT